MEFTIRDTNQLQKSKTNSIPAAEVCVNDLKETRVCYRCGNYKHFANKCDQKETKCSYCKKIGHKITMCRKKKQQASGNINGIVNSNEDPIYNATVDDIFQISEDKKNFRMKYLIDISVEGKTINFEVDSGAAATIISKKLFSSLFGNQKLEKAEI